MTGRARLSYGINRGAARTWKDRERNWRWADRRAVSSGTVRNPGRLLACVLTCALAGLGASQASAVAQSVVPDSGDTCRVETPERVVAIGDVHGAYSALVDILKAAGVVDERLAWTGGRTILVQLGDLFDRGPESRQAMDLLLRLEAEAPAAGGRVIALLGNHEVMRLMRDLRDVSAAEFAAFQSENAADYRDAFYGQLLAEQTARARASGELLDEASFRERFLAQVPLGFVEMQIAFEPGGEYGRLLRTRAVMARINGIVFVHGGVTPAVGALGCEAVNQIVRNELSDLPSADDPRAAKTLIAGGDGPLWFRGLALDDAPLDAAEVEEILRSLQARTIVVGHTPTGDGRIHTHFGNRVVQIDTGMLDGEFYPRGRPSALEIRGNTFTAIYTDGRDVLFERR